MLFEVRNLSGVHFVESMRHVRSAVFHQQSLLAAYSFGEEHDIRCLDYRRSLDVMHTVELELEPESVGDEFADQFEC
jgi:hypothetical protein